MGAIMAVGVASRTAKPVGTLRQRVREEGYSYARRPLIEDAASDFRPTHHDRIGMTLGMLHMAPFRSARARSKTRRSAAVIGGLIAATMMTLFVVRRSYPNWAAASSAKPSARQEIEATRLPR